MALNSTQVSIPSGGVEGFRRQGDVLTELGQSLLKQGDAQDERDRLAAAELESKRRFDLGVARANAQDAESSRRFMVEQANKEAARKLDADRWEINNKRTQTLHDNQMAALAQAKAEKDALKAVDLLASDGTLQAHKFGIGDYRPEMRDLLQGRLDHIAGTKSALANVLTAGPDYDPSKGTFDTVVKDYERLLSNSGLTPAAVKNMVGDFKGDILSLSHERANTPAEEWQSRVNDVVSKRFDPLTSSIQEGIEAGKGMLRRNAVNSVLRTLPENVRANILSTQADTMFGDRLDFSTEAQLKATEKARVDNLNTTEKIIYDRNLDKLKLIKDAGKSGSGSGGNKTAKGILSTFKALNVEGTSEDTIGSWDMEDVNKGVNFLIDEGMDPDAIAAVFMGGVESKWLGLDDDFPEVGTEAFAKLHKRVEDLGGKYSGGGNSSLKKALKDSESKFGYTPAQSKSLLDIQKGNFKVRGNNNYSLNTAAKYDAAASKRYGVPVEEVSKPTEANVVLPPPNSEDTTEEGLLTPTTLKLLDRSTPEKAPRSEANRSLFFRRAFPQAAPQQPKLTPTQSISRDILSVESRVKDLNSTLGSSRITSYRRRNVTAERDALLKQLTRLQADLLKASK